MTKRKHSASSKRWLTEHFDDHFVKEAQRRGLRSRAAFKLEEIQSKDKLLSPNMIVVDLGAAPGGWSQYAAEQVGTKGLVVACDLLPMDPIVGVDFLQGDFREQQVLDELLSRIGGQAVDVVLSDMAPNMSGNDSIDQPASLYLAELALDMCDQVLSAGGAMAVKVFQGEGFDQYQQQVRSKFRKTRIRKPLSSRPRSREVYIVASEFKR